MVTSDGLAHVTPLTELDTLILQGAAVDDRGMEHVRGLTHLSYVNVADTKITASGLRSLAQLPSLRGLCLIGTDVDDAAVPHLLAMKQLGEVDLSSTKLSGTGLLALDDARPDLEVQAEASNCSNMTLDGAKRRSLAFGKVASHWQQLNDDNRLKLVDLSGTPITDQHLWHLRGLKNLEALDLRETCVTYEGVRSLSEVLPNCQIRR